MQHTTYGHSRVIGVDALKRDKVFFFFFWNLKFSAWHAWRLQPWREATYVDGDGDGDDAEGRSNLVANLAAIFSLDLAVHGMHGPSAAIVDTSSDRTDTTRRPIFCVQRFCLRRLVRITISVNICRKDEPDLSHRRRRK